jgi:hypothetical protein
MALDKDGRPIPVSIPDPPKHDGQPTEVDVQFMLMAKKADDALRLAADLSRRMAALEQAIQGQLDNKLMDFEKRFDKMIGERITDVQKQVDAMVTAYPWRRPEGVVPPMGIE